MGDRKHLDLVHPASSRRRGRGVRLPKHKDSSGKDKPHPTTTDELVEDLTLLLHEWREWAEWVREDLLVLEGRTGLSLAPPPPPEDPWD